MIFSPQAARNLTAATLFAMLATVASTPVRPTVWGMLLLVYALVYLQVHRSSRLVDGLDLAVVLALLSHLFTSIPHLVREPNVSYYYSGPLAIAAAAPIYLMLRHALKDPSSLRASLEWGTAVGSTGALAVAVYQYFWLGYPRVVNFLDLINLGYVNVALLFLALGLMGTSTRRLLLAWAVAASTLVALLNTTRGALIVIPLLLAVWIVLNRQRVSPKALLAGTLGALALVFAAYNAIPAMQDRIAQSVDEARHLARGDLESPISTGDRLALWIAASHAFAQSPLTGLTRPAREQQIRELVEAGVVHPRITEFTGGHAHNHYFEMAASTGLLGLAAILAYIVFPAWLFLRRYLRDPSDDFALAGLLFVGAFLLFGMTEVPLKKDSIAVFYAYCLVALLALSLVHQRQVSA